MKNNIINEPWGAGGWNNDANIWRISIGIKREIVAPHKKDEKSFILTYKNCSLEWSSQGLFKSRPRTTWGIQISIC